MFKAHIYRAFGFPSGEWRLWPPCRSPILLLISIDKMWRQKDLCFGPASDKGQVDELRTQLSLEWRIRIENYLSGLSLLTITQQLYEIRTVISSGVYSIS